MRESKENWILSLFFLFSFVPDYILTFFSGIFISSSINIVTSQIPASVLDAGINFLIVAILFFVVSVLFMCWSVSIRKAFSFYEDNSSRINDDFPKKRCWYDGLVNNNLCRRLIIIVIAIFILLVVSVFLLVYVNNCNQQPQQDISSMSSALHYFSGFLNRQISV